MRNDVIRGFISILGAKTISLLLGLVITPLLVRLIGSSLYGDYAFVLSLVGISMIIANAGIFDGTRKYIAEDRDVPSWPEHVLGFYLRIAVLVAIVISAIYWSFSALGLPERFFGTGFDAYFLFVGALILARQSYTVARSGLMGFGLEDRSEPLEVVKTVLYGVIGLPLAYVGLDVSGVLFGHVLGTFVVAILGYTMLFRRLDMGAVLGSLPDGFPRRELLSFNSLSVILILLNASLYHVDILLLRPLSGSQATGYYRAALTIAEFLWFVPNALQMVLLHSTSELWSEGRTDRITALVSTVTRLNLAFVLLLAIGLAVLAEDFVPLYFGAEFESAIRPLLLLLPGVIGFSLARPIFAVGQGKGQLRTLIFATLFSSVLNLVLNLVLIPRYGYSGAAVATSISYGSMFLFHSWAAIRIGFDPLSDLRLARVSIVAVTSAVLIFATDSVIESSIISLLVVPVVGFSIYAILAIRLDVVSLEELQTFRGRVTS